MSRNKKSRNAATGPSISVNPRRPATSRRPAPRDALPREVAERVTEALSLHAAGLAGCEFTGADNVQPCRELLETARTRLTNTIASNRRWMAETGSDSWIPDVRLALTNYERLLAGLLDLYPPEPLPRAAPVFEHGLLTWEVLPPGHLDILYPPPGATRRPTAATGARADHTRIPFLRSLRPRQVWTGSHLGQRVYEVAEFPGVGIAETATYGNALFYFEGDANEWQRVFRREKSEALRLGAGRILHSGDWQQRVRDLVRGAP